MSIILEDGNLPVDLQTREEQSNKARELAAARRGIQAESVREPNGPQGAFSRTFIVTLKNQEKVVIQFRVQPMDLTPFKDARSVFGEAVPEIELLDDELLKSKGVLAYYMSYIPGQAWLCGISGRGAQGNISINRTLGRVLSKGFVAENSDGSVDTKVKPHLEVLKSSDSEFIRPFQPIIRDLLEKVDRLKKLPLFVSHADLNQLNIIVDDECRVTGIVDWEFSGRLPFGVGLGRVHTIVGEYSEGEFYMPEEFEIAEKAFWEELFAGMPADVRGRLEEDLELVELAVKIGTLLNAFELNGGVLGDWVNPVVVKALPKLLTYRIPHLRGSDPPYSG